MYFGGEWGTGKTIVVKALIYLTNVWGSPYSILTIVPAGKNVLLISG